MSRKHDYHVGDVTNYRLNVSARYTHLIRGVMDQLVKDGAIRGTNQCPRPLPNSETIVCAPERVETPRFYVVRTGHAEGRQTFGIKSRESGEVYGVTMTRQEALRYLGASGE